MNLAPAGIELVKRFEGLRLKAYRCPSDVWTIGYGHTAAAGPPRVPPGMMITEAEAEAILQHDLTDVAARVRALIDVALTDHQFSALVSFVFNVGIGAFRKSSVLARVNAGRFDEVPARLALWVRGGGKVLPGLVRRRAAEGALWAR